MTGIIRISNHAFGLPPEGQNAAKAPAKYKDSKVEAGGESQDPTANDRRHGGRPQRGPIGLNLDLTG